jgi:AcrR family transcriptional regulator
MIDLAPRFRGRGDGVTANPEGTRAPGRPRSEKARQAILAAAIGLVLDQGLYAVSMDEIARRAGVSKATIYRWWPSKERLVLDALAAEWATASAPGPGQSGNLRVDLLARLLPWIRQLKSQPFSRVVAGLVAEAQVNTEFAELYREHFVKPRRDATRELLVQAVERGEIGADTDFEITLDLLYGPIYHRMLHGHAPLTERFAEDVVDHVIAAVANR